MKKLVAILITLLSTALVMTGCSISASKEGETDGPAFAIYLVKGTDGYGINSDDLYKPYQEQLDDLTLDDEPLLTDEDLASYRWRVPVFKEIDTISPFYSEYADLIELNGDKSLEERIKEKTGSTTKLFPFVVVVNGERIYAGVFTSPLSSLAFPKGIRVAVNYLMPQGENSYMLLEGTSTNLRHDERIYKALKEVDKLRE